MIYFVKKINEYKTNITMTNENWFKAVRNNDLNLIIRYINNEFDVNIQDQYNDNNTALIISSCRGYLDIVIELLKCPDINVNIQNKFNNTALILAYSWDRDEIVKELLNRPDIILNIKNSNNSSVYTNAIEKNDYNMINFLKSKGITQ